MVSDASGQKIVNGLLRSLPMETLARLRPHLEPVDLSRKQVLYSPGEDATWIYFIDRGLVSLVKWMGDGRTVEIASIGSDGAVGLGAVFGISRTFLEAQVQLPGSAARIRSEIIRDIAADDVALSGMVKGSIAYALKHVAQNAACNRLHNLDQRCSRWLLTAHDNAGADTFQITHEVLAVLLGVQRPGVSIAARGLQEAGLIEYRNGRMTIIDRTGLEASACECYRATRLKAP